eukprot:354287-Chlamydomonas_euryale.AAC.4
MAASIGVDPQAHPRDMVRGASRLTCQYQRHGECKRCAAHCVTPVGPRPPHRRALAGRSGGARRSLSRRRFPWAAEGIRQTTASDGPTAGMRAVACARPSAFSRLPLVSLFLCMKPPQHKPSYLPTNEGWREDLRRDFAKSARAAGLEPRAMLDPLSVEASGMVVARWSKSITRHSVSQI